MYATRQPNECQRGRRLRGRDCITIYGPLDNFSAFPFETKLCQIKRLVKSGYKAIEQIANPPKRISLSLHIKGIELLVKHISTNK